MYLLYVIHARRNAVDNHKKGLAIFFDPLSDSFSAEKGIFAGHRRATFRVLGAKLVFFFLLNCVS